MGKVDYNIINDYLNNLSLKLFESKDFENNYSVFMYINDNFLNYFAKRYFQEESYHIITKQNNMTYQEIIDISRNIIASYNLSYINIFDNLLNDGTLDFSFEGEYYDSHVQHVFNDGKLKSRIININRAFNYTDIEVLIHEFTHYVCFIGNGIRNKILGEFLSIYFELYAIEYIYKNYKISLEELFYNRRIINAYYQACKIKNVQLPLYLFMSLGNIDENSYKDASVIINNYTKIKYDYECSEILKSINDKNNNKDSVFSIEDDHYYLIATYLAYYFRKNATIDDILNFMKNINNKDNVNLDLFEILNKYNLNINNNSYKDIFLSMNEYLDIFEADKKQR